MEPFRHLNKGNGCGSFETTPGVENPRVEAGFSDTLWSLRTILIIPFRSETQQSPPPRGFEKLRGQVDRTGGDCHRYGLKVHSLECD